MELYSPNIIPIVTTIIILIIGFSIVWIFKNENSFGDKLLWLVLVILLPVFGSFLYLLYRLIGLRKVAEP